MHPIERLRFLARAPAGFDSATLAVEAAFGLVDVAAEDPAGLIVAVRQLLVRNPARGVLWWVAQSILTASDVEDAAIQCARIVGDDRCAEPSSAIRAFALGAAGVAAPPGSAAAVADRISAGDAVVLWVPIGTCVPDGVWDQICSAELGGDADLIGAELVTRVVDPSGECSLAEAAGRCGWTMPPELAGIIGRPSFGRAPALGQPGG